MRKAKRMESLLQFLFVNGPVSVLVGEPEQLPAILSNLLSSVFTPPRIQH